MLGCLKESCGLSRELQQKDLGNFAVHTLGIEADANENPIDLYLLFMDAFVFLLFLAIALI
jgi:hypothetical protein